MDDQGNPMPSKSKEISYPIPTSSKKAKRLCTFNSDYALKYPGIVMRSKLSENHIFCTVCSKDFRIASGGMADLDKHISSIAHQNLARKKCIKSTPTLHAFTCDTADKVIHAEALFTNFLIEHNLPLSVSDHAGPLFNKMFPDSTIAKKYSCARTKTTAILKTFSEDTVSNVLKKIGRNPFTISTDGSNDRGSHVKYYPIGVRYYDHEIGKVIYTCISLSSNVVIENEKTEYVPSTGLGIFKLLDLSISKLNLSWDQCIGFSCDNTNSMVGIHNGVAAHIRSVNPKLTLVGCPCHLIHKAADKATQELGIDVASFFTDVFYFLDKSSKRLCALKEFQDNLDLPDHVILKLSSTRWLSMLHVIRRTIEQWSALEGYFRSLDITKTKGVRLPRIIPFFDNKVNKLYLFFLESALPIFTIINEILQSEEPLIHVLYDLLHDLLTNLFVRFVSSNAIKRCKSILSVEFYKRKNQKERDDLVLGYKTKQYYSEVKTEVSTEDKDAFYKSVRSFYVKACTYILSSFPLNDVTLKNAMVSDIGKREDAKFESVMYFVDKFSSCLSLSLDTLEVEFNYYKIDDLPADIVMAQEIHKKIKSYGTSELSREQLKEVTKLKEQCLDMSQQWHILSLVTNQSTGNLRYPNLSKLMLGILVLPHSNAGDERIFSLVRKNLTDFRSSLGAETLEALIIEKSYNISSSKKCYERNFSQVLLHDAKKATMKKLSSS